MLRARWCTRWWRGWGSASRAFIPTSLGGLAILLAAAWGWSAPAAPEAFPAQPSEMPVALASQSVLDVGDQMARILATTDTIPADLDLMLDQVRVRASAGQCFLLFCDFFAAWYQSGTLPAQVSLERFSIAAAPEADAAEPMAAPPSAGDQAPAVQTSRLLVQCGPAADMVRRTRSLPGGIWVQGRRLRTAEFLGAMATILQQLRVFGVAPDLVAVRPYRPPARWVEAAAAARTAPAVAEPGPADLVPAEPPVEPLSIRLIPAEQKAVQGLTPITAIYHGPAAFLRLVIDGRPVAVSNISPFTFVWDTRLEADGAHSVMAEALAGGTILAQAGVTLTADNGGPAL